ncbi:glycohydrolase toxin TNT-related protein [Actinokineospora sp. G85]|uniref:glycohydrolase toxin TNT-related protein n=1 Tax=Actinokineospora sp. G85 TaxID=3406626 RepID=UPI003C749622
MAQPTQLNPTEQDALVKQIGLALLRSAPENWQTIQVEYRALGRYTEVVGRVAFADDNTEPMQISPETAGLFGRLRAGMYREGRGTWYNARYQLDQPSAYNLEYDRDEPQWLQPPPPPAYADDLRTFPRDEENVPEWLTRRMAALKPPFRVARLFDAPGPDGRPTVNRPPVDEADREALLRYLDSAPLPLPARGLDTDLLDEEHRQAVPVAFHTDGVWIWAAAVNYYLRTHGVPPEPDLVEHVRRAEFTVPEVPEQALGAAGAFLSRGQARRPGPPAAPAPGAEQPAAPVEQAEHEQPAQEQPEQDEAPAAPQVVDDRPEPPAPQEKFDAFAVKPVDDAPAPWDRPMAEDVDGAPATWSEGLPGSADAAVRPGRPTPGGLPGAAEGEWAPNGLFEPGTPESGRRALREEEPERADDRYAPVEERFEHAGPTEDPDAAADDRHTAAERFDEPAEEVFATTPDDPFRQADDFHQEADYDAPAAEEPYSGFTPPPAQEPVELFTHPDQPSPAVAAVESEQAEPEVFGLVRERLTDLGVPAEHYTIGVPEHPGWAVAQTDEGWQVGWFDSGFTVPAVPAVFADPADAGAFLVGKVLLSPAPEPVEPHASHVDDEEEDGPLFTPAQDHRAGQFDNVHDEHAPAADRQAFAGERYEGPRDQYDDAPEGGHPAAGQFGAEQRPAFTGAPEGFAGESDQAPYDDRRDGGHEPPAYGRPGSGQEVYGGHDTGVRAGYDHPNPGHEPHAQAEPGQETYGGRDADYQQTEAFSGHDAGNRAGYGHPDPNHEPHAQAEPGQEVYGGRDAASHENYQQTEAFNGHDTANRAAYSHPDLNHDAHAQAEPDQETYGGRDAASHENYQQTEAFNGHDTANRAAYSHPDPNHDAHAQAEPDQEVYGGRAAAGRAPFAEGGREASGQDGFSHGEAPGHDGFTEAGRPGQEAFGAREEGAGQEVFTNGSRDVPNREAFGGRDGFGEAGHERDDLAGEQRREAFGAQHSQADQPGRAAYAGAPNGEGFGGPGERREAFAGRGRSVEQARQEQFAAEQRQEEFAAGQEQFVPEQGRPEQGRPEPFAGGEQDGFAPEARRAPSRRPEGATAQVAAPTAAIAQAAPSQPRRPQDWPIQPRQGEPPLTLFRGKQLLQLAPGTEIDRYGEPSGNLTYAAGTPFERRSLVPDWVGRPYRAYRVVKPTEALTGVAIPWFDQPGGGTAYLLAGSIAELVDNGHLVEVNEREAPTRP